MGRACNPFRYFCVIEKHVARREGTKSLRTVLASTHATETPENPGERDPTRQSRRDLRSNAVGGGGASDKKIKSENRFPTDAEYYTLVYLLVVLVFDYVLVVRRVHQPSVRVLEQVGLVVNVRGAAGRQGRDAVRVVVLVHAVKSVELREGQQADAGRARLLLQPVRLLQLFLALHGDGIVHGDGGGRRTGHARRHAQLRLDVHLEFDGVVVRGRAGRQPQIEIRVGAATAAGRLVFPGPVMVHFIRDRGTVQRAGPVVVALRPPSAPATTTICSSTLFYSSFFFFSSFYASFMMFIIIIMYTARVWNIVVPSDAVLRRRYLRGVLYVFFFREFFRLFHSRLSRRLAHARAPAKRDRRGAQMAAAAAGGCCRTRAHTRTHRSAHTHTHARDCTTTRARTHSNARNRH